MATKKQMQPAPHVVEGPESTSDGTSREPWYWRNTQGPYSHLNSLSAEIQRAVEDARSLASANFLVFMNDAERVSKGSELINRIISLIVEAERRGGYQDAIYDLSNAALIVYHQVTYSYNENYMSTDRPRGAQALNSHLSEITRILAEDPSLVSVFRQSDLYSQIVQGTLDDPVAREIAAEVTDRWADRKSNHQGELWIRNPRTFVEHVYGKWYRAKTLRLVHLKHDPTLYLRYIKHISDNPRDDLGLPKAPSGRRSVRPNPRNQ